MIRRVAILTSGGDAPGMNAAIRAATSHAHSRGWDVVGVSNGYRGLLEGDFAPLAPADVAPIVRQGGTILGSSRCPAFHEPAARHVARRLLLDAGIEALIAIGGNGSLAGAAALADASEGGIHTPLVIGVPASIDNDIVATSMSIGVDTAVNTIVDACDKIADTADAHDRTFIVEVMGRQCGYLALTSAIASGADAVLFPEAGRSDVDIVDAVVDAIVSARERAGHSRRVLVIMAEGVSIGADQLKTNVDDRMRALPGADPHATETRVTVLGHVVRGGRPSAFDRVLATRFGQAAAAAATAGITGVMTAWAPPVRLVRLAPPAGADSSTHTGAGQGPMVEPHTVDTAVVQRPSRERWFRSQ